MNQVFDSKLREISHFRWVILACQRYKLFFRGVWLVTLIQNFKRLLFSPPP